MKILSLFEKNGVIDSIEAWQRCRAARNLAAHDYETDYAEIARHFNMLHELGDMLYGTAKRLLRLYEENLAIKPSSEDFAEVFERIVARLA